MKRAFILALISFSSVSLIAQNQRTFLSGTGLDTNPCSVTQPCRSIPIALGVTNAGGEIVVLDSAGYGQTVTINKAVNIVVPPGIFGAMTPATPGTIALQIALPTATTNDVVRIDGLQILGSGAANAQIGVSVGNCFRAHLSNMKIKNVGYPVKVVADVRVSLKEIDASEFLDGLWTTGVNTDANTTTLKVFAVGCSFIGGQVGIQGDTGIIEVFDTNSGLNGNRMAFMSVSSYVAGTHVSTCSSFPSCYFCGTSNDTRNTGANCSSY
jgi:hypothetical protein